MLQDLQEFANHIQRLDKAVNAFERHTRGKPDCAKYISTGQEPYSTQARKQHMHTATHHKLAGATYNMLTPNCYDVIFHCMPTRYHQPTPVSNTPALPAAAR